MKDVEKVIFTAEARRRLEARMLIPEMEDANWRDELKDIEESMMNHFNRYGNIPVLITDHHFITEQICLGDGEVECIIYDCNEYREPLPEMGYVRYPYQIVGTAIISNGTKNFEEAGDVHGLRMNSEVYLESDVLFYLSK